MQCAAAYTSVLDSMRAIAKLADGLNKLFEGINASADQVSVGVKQVSDGTQLLAQGSTEQAAAMVELSSQFKLRDDFYSNRLAGGKTYALSGADAHFSGETPQHSTQMFGKY